MKVRYQIVYSKNGVPGIMWVKTLGHADTLFHRLSAVGYTVTVAEHTASGSRVIRGGLGV